MSDSQDAYEEIINEINIKQDELTVEEYKEFLEELHSEINVRIQLIEEEST